MAYARTGFTIQTNGQTLIVAITGPFGNSATIYSNAALTSAVTLPQVITSDTTYYVSDSYLGRYTVSAKQQDGTELWGGKVDCFAGDGFKTITPLPSSAQVAVDLQKPRGYLSGGSSGLYYMASLGSGITTTTPTLNYLILTPWIVPNSCTISQIGVDVTAGGTSGSVHRIGLYADNGYGYPGSLIQECAATIDGTSATVQDAALTPAVSLTPGLYWIGGASQVATMTLRAWNLPTMPIPMRIGTAVGAGSFCTGYIQGSVTGALPATFTSTLTAAAAAGRYHVKVDA